MLDKTKQGLIELRKLASKVLHNFGEVTVNSGEVLIFKGDVLTINEAVYIYNDEGVMVNAPSNEYVLQTGESVTINDGWVVSIIKNGEVVEETPSTEEVVEPVEEEPVVELAETILPDVPTEEVVEPVEEEVDSDPNQEVVDIVKELVEKITELNGVISKMQTQMSLQEKNIKTIGKFTRVDIDVIEERPVASGIKLEQNKKQSYLDRILSAK